MARVGIRVAMLAIVLADCASGQIAATPNLHGALADAGEGSVVVDAAEAAEENAPVVVCQGPRDCMGNPPAGLQVWCCIDKACVFGESAVAARPCTDANAQLIQASSYDQSCKADSDCVGVTERDFCSVNAVNCPNAAISMSALARYRSDVAKTNAGI